LPVNHEITPEPDDAERRAILSALADDEAEPARSSAWSDALLPSREGSEEMEP